MINVPLSSAAPNHSQLLMFADSSFQIVLGLLSLKLLLPLEANVGVVLSLLTGV